MARESLRVRPFQPGDAAGVRRVLEATYGEAATPAPAYDWWSFGCPVAVNGGMVAEVDDQIVGVQPMELFPYRDGAVAVTGAMLTGVAVHPDFRRRGVFSALVTACEAEAWRREAAFVTTMPNERSRPGFLKFGYTDLGRRALLVRPVDGMALGGKWMPGLGHLAGAVGSAIQTLVKTIPRTNETSVRKTTTVPAAISTLIARHVRLFPGLLLQRSADWLRWRFLQAPTRQYQLLEAHDHAGQLIGFAAATLDDREKARRYYLMDLFVAEEKYVADLLHALVGLAQNQKAEAVATVVSSPRFAVVLQRAGFWMVPDWLPLKRFYSVARFNPQHSLSPAWRTLAGWYQTLADWDNL